MNMKFAIINNFTNVVKSKLYVFTCLFELLLNINILKAVRHFATRCAICTLGHLLLSYKCYLIFNEHLPSKTRFEFRLRFFHLLCEFIYHLFVLVFNQVHALHQIILKIFSIWTKNIWGIFILRFMVIWVPFKRIWLQTSTIAWVNRFLCIALLGTFTAHSTESVSQYTWINRRTFSSLIEILWILGLLLQSSVILTVLVPTGNDSADYKLWLFWTPSWPAVFITCNLFAELTSSIINRHPTSSYFILKHGRNRHTRVKRTSLSNPVSFNSCIRVSTFGSMFYHTF